MSRSDETSSPFLADENLKEEQVARSKIFPEGRNFR